MGTTTVEDLVVQVSLEDLLTNGLSAMQDAFKKFGDLADSIGGKLGESFGPVGVSAVVTAGIFENLTAQVLSFADSMIHKPIEAAVALDAVMVSLGAAAHLTGDELDALKGKLEASALAAGQSTDSLGRVAITAARLGLSGDDLELFTDTVSKFATVSGQSADEVAREFTSLRAVFSDTLDGSTEALTKLASGFVALGAQGTATAGEIADAVAKVGSGATLGLDPETIGAVVTEMSKLGISAEAAGQTLNSAFLTMNKNVEIAGYLVKMTGDQFKKAMGEDANKAVLSVIKAIGDITSGTDQMTQAVNVFGARGAKSIVQVATHFEDLEKLVKTSNDATEKATALSDKFNVIIDTTAGVITRVKEAFAQVGEAIGAGFLPGVDAGARGMLAFGTALLETLKDSKETVQVIASVGLAMTAIGAIKGFQTGSLTEGLGLVRSLFTDLTPMILSSGKALLSVGTYSEIAAAGFRGLVAVSLPLIELYALVKLMPKALEGWKLILDNIIYGFELLTEKVKGWMGAVSTGSGLMANLEAIALKALDVFTAALSAIGGFVGSIVKLAFDAIASIVTQLQKIPILARGIPDGMVDALNAAGVLAVASSAKIGKEIGESFKGAMVSVAGTMKDFFAGATVDTMDIAAGQAEHTAAMTQIGAMNANYQRLRETIHELGGDIKLTDEQVVDGTRKLKDNDSAWQEVGSAMRAGIGYADAMKMAQSMLADEVEHSADKQRLLKAGFGDTADALAKMSPILTAVNNAFKGTSESIDTGAADAMVRLTGKLKANATEINDLVMKVQALSGANAELNDTQKQQLLSFQKQDSALRATSKSLAEQINAIGDENGASENLKRAFYALAPAATAAATSHATVAAAAVTSAHKQMSAFEQQKFALTSWSKHFELQAKYIVDMSKITEEQIVGSMKAMADSIHAVSGSITGMAPVMKDLLDPTRNFSMFGNELQSRLLNQFQLQAQLVEQQVEINQENLASLRQKRAMTAAGVAASFRIKVEGTDPAMTSLVREVTERLMLQATREGGELCCG